MRFRVRGSQNFFKEFREQLGKTGEEKFQLRGGHRVWKAPEDPIATWAPDNVRGGAHHRERRGGTRAGRAAHRAAKRDRVEMEPSGTRVTVTHRMRQQDAIYS